MKQYIIDELRLEDYDKLKKYLDDTAEYSGMTGIYRLFLPDELLTEKQKQHQQDGCGKHFITLDLDETQFSCELLIRAKKTLRCDCIVYATNSQREWIFDTVDALVEKVGIIT